MDIPPILPPSLPSAPAPTPAAPAKQSGCLKALLVLLMLYNALMAAGNVLGAGAKQLLPADMASKVPTEPGWITLSYTLYSVFSILVLIFIFRWQKWAVLAYGVLSFAMFAAFLASGKSLPGSAEVLVGPLFLFGLLKVGGQNSAWKHLR